MALTIVTWNVNGLRSNIVDGLDSKKFKEKTTIASESALGTLLFEVNPQILCMQETRCSLENISKFNIPDWQIYAVSSKLDGARSENRYSGCCVWVNKNFEPPTDVIPFLSTLPKEHYLNNEGRYIELHFAKKNLVLINCYVPNMGGSMVMEANKTGNKDAEYLYENNDRILKWDPALRQHIVELQNKGLQVILCGDLNCAYTPQDVFFCDPDIHFKKGYTDAQLQRFFQSTKVQGLGKQRLAGFSFHERQNFDVLLKTTGMVDIWRERNPEKKQYSWFNLRQKSQREKKLGWRLDYFLISSKIVSKVTDTGIMDSIGEGEKYASDHVPVYMCLDV